MNVLFRADSGDGVGHGHAARVEALSRATILAGGNTRTVSMWLPGHRPQADDLAPVLWLDSTTLIGGCDGAEIDDAARTFAASAAAQFSPDVIVVDNYKLGIAWERLARTTGAFVVAIEDCMARMHDADLVVEFLPAPFPKSGRLSGIEYFPMDRGFALPPRDTPAAGLRLLLTFGGTDPTGHTAIALDALDQLDRENPSMIAHTSVVLGSGHPNPEEIRARVIGHPCRLLHRQVQSLAPLMAESDIVVTSAGNTLPESVAARRMTVAVVTAPNQAALANALGHAGVALVIPDATSASAQALAVAVQEATGIKGARMRAALRNYPLDAFGADRLMMEIFRVAGGR